jgi:hypothetical protein
MTLLLNKVSTALNDKKHSVIIFCDLKKAFDTCNHTILLTKLRKLGICGTELAWFKSYLTDRSQYVTIDKIDSVLLSILTGVPQGSILGPLLFLIYINDLPSSTQLYSLLFADDTALTASNHNIEELYQFVNTEFKKLCTYFRQNKLSLHPEKTKYLLVTYSNNPVSPNLNIYIDNNNNNEYDVSKIFTLHRVTSSDKVPAIKYLGVFFDPNLNFKHHISYISSKLSRALYSLRAVKNLLPAKTLKTLYFSLFHCHLIYAIEIWSSVPFSTLQPLISKQKAAIRIISNRKYNDHTEPLFKQHSILPLADLITQFNLKFFHSYVFNHTPLAFNGTWLTNRVQRNNENLNLRDDDEYFIPRHRTDLISRLPYFNLPRLWNQFSPNLSTTPNRLTYANATANFFLDKLNSTPICNRLVCPSCIIANAAQ